jgi:hypothetical protein
VWQLAFGSGFKFNSCVLVANRRVQEAHVAWQGFDSQVRSGAVSSAHAVHSTGLGMAHECCLRDQQHSTTRLATMQHLCW